MKNFTLAALLGAVTFLGTTASSWAQTAEPVVPSKATPESPRKRAVKIKNVPSDVVAYQLDPVHNRRPVSFGGVDEDETQTERQGAFTLPEGITQIVSVDPQNVLLVGYTNDEAMRQVQELIAVLDQPLRQIGIEAQFVEMSKADFKSFNFDFSEPEGETPAIDFGFARSNFASRLNAIVAEGSAKIIWAPQVTANNTLTATIISTEKEIVDGKPVTVMNDYRITPIINDDGKIAISFKITANENNEPDEFGRSTATNLRDGGTIALLGVMSAQHHVGDRITIVDASGLRPTDPDRVVVVFLTPGIARYK